MALDTSFFISETLQEREVTLPNGSKHALYFKELSAIEFRKFQMAETSDDEEVKAASVAKLIALSLTDDKGKPALSTKEAARLNNAASNALLAVILEINGFNSKNA